MINNAGGSHRKGAETLVARRVTDKEVSRTRRPPATTPEARENQLTAAALDLVEKQIVDGTVSATVLALYVKNASSREKLEQQRIYYENKLTEAKIESFASQKKIEEMYGEALAAMRRYSGQDPLPTAGDYDDDPHL